MGCAIASELYANTNNNLKRPVIFGGSVLDAYGKFLKDTPGHTKATELGRVFLSAGGVGRNVADCIARHLPDDSPVMVSTIANDAVGQLIQSLGPKNLDFKETKILDTKDKFYSPSYVGHLDKNGQYLVGIGDFVAMDQLNPDDILYREEGVSNAPLAVVDGNLPVSVFPSILALCNKHQCPIYLECTDIYKALRLYDILAKSRNLSKEKIDDFNCVAAISPNFEEFLQLLSFFLGDSVAKACKEQVDIGKDHVSDECVDLLATFCKKLIANNNFAPHLFLKMGHHGVLSCHLENEMPTKPWRKSYDNSSKSVSITHYSALPEGFQPQIVSVSGAGDWFVKVSISSSSQLRKLFF